MFLTTTIIIDPITKRLKEDIQITDPLDDLLWKGTQIDTKIIKKEMTNIQELILIINMRKRVGLTKEKKDMEKDLTEERIPDIGENKMRNIIIIMMMKGRETTMINIEKEKIHTIIDLIDRGKTEALIDLLKVLQVRRI